MKALDMHAPIENLENKSGKLVGRWKWEKRIIQQEC